MSIVKGENGEPLIDTLVRPSDPVVDWRTSIHGVAPKHLEGVIFTHRCVCVCYVFSLEGSRGLLACTVFVFWSAPFANVVVAVVCFL